MHALFVHSKILTNVPSFVRYCEALLLNDKHCIVCRQTQPPLVIVLSSTLSQWSTRVIAVRKQDMHVMMCPHDLACILYNQTASIAHTQLQCMCIHWAFTHVMPIAWLSLCTCACFGWCCSQSAFVMVQSQPLQDQQLPAASSQTPTLVRGSAGLPGGSPQA